MSVAKLSHPNILAVYELGKQLSTITGQPDTAFVVTGD